MRSYSFRPRHLVLAGLAAAFACPTSFAADWSELQITFVYDAAKAPERKKVDMSKDPNCVALHKVAPLSEELIVEETSKGIKNIVLYPDTKKSGLEAADTHPDLKEAPAAATLVLDNVKCVFEPHILPLRSGQSLTVKNSDAVGHNANFNFFVNQAVNVTIPSNGQKDVKTTKPEKAPIPVECNIHPWMKAHVIVFEHPYTGVSDDKGVLKIEKLPAGKPITFKVWHESQNKSIESVNFGGKDVQWKKGNFEITLKPGVNDLGVVKIKPEGFTVK